MKHILLALVVSASALWSQTLPAFPTAEGFGKWAKGGRGGEVYQVTTLADSGPGSLRDALTKSGRTIVFTVGGVIKIGERLIVPANTTIAGQTAPGGGITIYGNGVAYNTNNVITRHIRIRMGKIGDSGKDAVSISEGHTMIWDHVSISWGRDGTFDANPNSGKTIENITIQNCIIGQGLQTHSTGGLMIANGASILRSLYINNNSRNPKARQTTQFVNNVVYNWAASGYILGDTEGRSDGYLVGNWFATGPNTSGSVLNSPTPSYHVYAHDNYYDNNKDGIMNGRYFGQGDFGTATWHTTPSVSFPAVTEWTAMQAYERVFANVGANRWRDPVDSVFLANLKSLGKAGTQPSDEASLGLPNVVGNIPGGTAPTDTDKDGMPDTWETAKGLNANNATDRNGTNLSADGYTNLEMYLNELAGDPVVYKTGVSSSNGVSSSSSATPISSSIMVSSSVTPLIAECGSTPCTTVLQGENFCNADGVSENKNSGYMGEGYLNLTNASGSAVGYVLQANASGSQNLFIRFSNAGTTPRSIRITSGGQVLMDSLAFASTGLWTSWSSQQVSLQISAGRDSLVITSLTADGAPNIDWIGWTGTGLTIGSCNGSPVAIQNVQKRKSSIQGRVIHGNLYLTDSPETQVRHVNGRIVQSIRNSHEHD